MQWSSLLALMVFLSLSACNGDGKKAPSSNSEQPLPVEAPKEDPAVLVTDDPEAPTPEPEPVRALFDRALEYLGPAAARAAVETIVARAECSAPQGRYTTEVHSSLPDDYVFFQQKFDFNPQDMTVHAESWQRGYRSVMGGQAGAILAPEAIAVVKNHEFHEILLDFRKRYKDFTLEEGEQTFHGVPCRVVVGKDRAMLTTVRLFFNTRNGRMEGLQIKNPLKGTEVVTITFDDWQPVAGLRLPRKVTMAQAGNTFVLRYESLKINAPEFKREFHMPEG